MDTKHSRVFTSLAIVLLIITACDHIPALRGSGNLTTETRPVSGFTAVELNGAGEVEIIQDGSESLTIETDDEIMKYISTEVRDGTLVVSQHLGSPTPTRLDVTLHVNELTGISIPGKWSLHAKSLATDILAIRVEGTTSIRIGALAAEELTVTITGTGDLELAGSAIAQTLVISGTGTYHAGRLHSETTSLVVSGAGDITLWATKTLDMKIEGTCTIDYFGRPVINIAQTKACVIHNLGDK
jgi:hypothetical protein